MAVYPATIMKRRPKGSSHTGISSGIYEMDETGWGRLAYADWT